MKLVAFCGYMGSGKTFAADYLVDGLGYTRSKFAGPLKDMLRVMGLNEEEIEGDLKHTPSELLCGRTPRWAMQTLGTEWGRDCIGEDIWGNLWEQRVTTLLAAGMPVVVDDCRFENETQRVKKLGGLVIQLQTRDSGREDRHRSENLPDDPDVTIINEMNNPYGLFSQIDNALKSWGVVAGQQPNNKHD